MNYENVLLIGGPKDGDRIQVMPGLAQVIFDDIKREVAPFSRATANEPVTLRAVTRAVYNRSQVASDKGFTGAVYTFEGVDAMPHLIKGYRGSQAAFEAMAAGRSYNTEQYEGRYVSKITQELYDFWMGGKK